ncbi:transglycosylase domain-containing protein [Oenococcus alcoholitolerans]|uniref:transglycosylase domain-containing protein n=1 Tax=Oenococcus alcoholitolerans TaxID=931074 RepID=UPI003F72B87A
MKKETSKLKELVKRFQLIRWVILFFASLFFISSIYLIFQAKIADVDKLSRQLAKPTIIYDRNGQQAGELADQKGDQVSFDKISPYLTDAVISTEDRNFYHEHGFSISGFARAGFLFLRNKLLHRDYISGGGSTITQQLAKNAYLTQKQTFSRKFRELFLAVEIEKHYSKDQILAMYLNSAYFGHNIYGVQDAAEGYFGVPASDLTVEQAASIAGMLANPTLYDPTRFPEYAANRRKTVINNMLVNKKIDSQQAQKALSAPFYPQNPSVNSKTNYQYPWFFDSVINEAINKYGLSETDIMNRGYRIFTTLDQNDQTALQNDYQNDYLFPVADDQSASIALDAKTGGVLAVIGGRNSHTFRGFNRANQMRRSPGSLIKPLVVYAPAVERGYNKQSIFPNSPRTFSGGYRPENALGYSSQSVDMQTAIANSYNIPAVYLMSKMSVKTGFDYAKRFDLPVQRSDRNLSLALGGMSHGVSPQQMAQAYTAFANHGLMSQAHYITKIVDASGKVVVSSPKVHQKRVISRKTAETMTSMMFQVYRTGTGAFAAPGNFVVAGKTGTTEDVDNPGTPLASKDLWAAAYTPDLVTVSWQGYDSSTSGKSLPAFINRSLGPLFREQTIQLIDNSPKTPFDQNNGNSLLDRFNNSWNEFWQNSQGNLNKFGQQISGVRQALENIWNQSKSFFDQFLNK